MAYSGNLIRKEPLVPTQSRASGIWTMDQAQAALKSNTWPVANGVSRSLRFYSSDNTHLIRTNTVTGNRQTFTISWWAKLSNVNTTRYQWEGGSPDGYNTRLACRIVTDNTLYIMTGTLYLMVTTAVFRDPTAWYHFVLAVDTTQATDSNRLKLYVNGQQITSFSTVNYPAQNTSLGWNLNQQHSIGRTHIDGGSVNDGYMAEFVSVDGLQLDPTYFGFTDSVGQWRPKRYDGVYGVNGFYLDFSDNSTTTSLGLDRSGNGNHWATNGFSIASDSDSMTESPTNYNVDLGLGGEVRSNYATWDSLVAANYNNVSVMGDSIVVFANGNLDLTNPANGGFAPRMQAFSTLGMSSGKWYAEFTNLSNCNVGIAKFPIITGTGNAIDSYIHYSGSGNTAIGNNASGVAFGTASALLTSDILGVAFDADNAKITWYKNGVETAGYTNITTTSTGNHVWKFDRSPDSSGSASSCNANFGQRPFAYTPPAGFKALCTQNLPTPAIPDPSQHFATVLYTGNGVNAPNAQTVTGLNFQPDLVWIKSRSNAESHWVQDSVRGTGVALNTNNNSIELVTGGGDLSAFNSNGFTLSYNNTRTNANGYTYAAWCWRAGGAATANNDGAITGQVSVNSTAGFSIVSYTGTGSNTTVGHGLGAAPNFVIWKARDDAYNWDIYHSSLGYTSSLIFTTAQSRNVLHAAPTSTTLPVTHTYTGGSATGKRMIAYCWREIPGFSKFGTFTGTGNANGPIVYCGFRPAFLLMKCASGINENWTIYDNRRSTFNLTQAFLRPDENSAESTGIGVDFLSTGFKIRSTDTKINSTSGTYVYVAFAEIPTNYARAR